MTDALHRAEVFAGALFAGIAVLRGYSYNGTVPGCLVIVTSRSELTSLVAAEGPS